MTVLLEFYYLTALLEYTKPAMTTAVVLIPALSNQGRIQEPAMGGAQTGYVVGGNRESRILLLVAAFLKQQIITS